MQKQVDHTLDHLLSGEWSASNHKPLWSEYDQLGTINRYGSEYDQPVFVWEGKPGRIMCHSPFIQPCFFLKDIEFELNDPGIADYSKSSIYDLETSNLEKSLKTCHFELSKELHSYQSLIEENESPPEVLHSSTVNVLASTEIATLFLFDYACLRFFETRMRPHYVSHKLSASLKLHFLNNGKQFLQTLITGDCHIQHDYP